ncbi:MAG TPA: 50S ribosomal protein L6 [Sphaerochaeta sp.]|nr:50S ribosomal protein L6 [Sphaerochaeta sp.]HOQ94027.1 50S ribosomal protein L6 [Sphaerochaeta sp.]
MSRIGKMPITVPASVKVAVKDGYIHVEGPKGKLNCKTRDEVTLKIGKEEIIVEVADDSKTSNSYHGLYRQLIHNMVVGVSTGFSKSLIINGVGFRADLKDNILSLNLGFAQPIDVVVPQGITVTVETPNKITLSGIDKQLVGQTAAEIRSLRKPEPYKGKGIRYEDEVIRRKAGKTASGKK